MVTRAQQTKAVRARRQPQETNKQVATEYKDLGLPSREHYVRAETEYIESLSQRKREKALLSQEMFDDIWDVLHDPGNPTTRTPQFRFWVRKMFTLSVARRDHDGSLFAENEDADVKPVILHENRPVAVKTQIYDILGYCHQISRHGGRDRTVAKVRELYSWVPKELVAKYVKVCPTCVLKKSGNMTLALSLRSSDAPPVEARTHEGNPSRTARSQIPSLQHRSETQAYLPAVVQHDIAQGQTYSSMIGATLLSRAFPLLPPPSVLASRDPGQWLADLALQPGPGSLGLELPPLLRRTESENDASPLRRLTTRITLPPLMKALSESMIDPVRPPFHVPEAFRIPPIQELPSIVNECGQYQPMEIDPVLLLEDQEMALVSQFKGPGANTSYRPLTSFATPFDLPRKILVSSNSLETDARSGRISASSIGSKSSPSASLGKLSVSGSLAANVSTASSAGQKSNRSFDAQDWESTYCLDESI